MPPARATRAARAEKKTTLETRDHEGAPKSPHRGVSSSLRQPVNISLTTETKPHGDTFHPNKEGRGEQILKDTLSSKSDTEHPLGKNTRIQLYRKPELERVNPKVKERRVSRVNRQLRDSKSILRENDKKKMSEDSMKETDTFLQLIFGVTFHVGKLLIQEVIVPIFRSLDQYVQKKLFKNQPTPTLKSRSPFYEFKVHNEFDLHSFKKQALAYERSGFQTAELKGQINSDRYVHEFITKGQFLDSHMWGFTGEPFAFQITSEAVHNPYEPQLGIPKNQKEVSGYLLTAGWLLENQNYSIYIRSRDQATVKDIHLALAERIWQSNDTSLGVENALKWLLNESPWGKKGKGILQDFSSLN